MITCATLDTLRSYCTAMAPDVNKRGENGDDGEVLSQWPSASSATSPPPPQACQQEAQCLDQFSRTYQGERHFSQHPQQHYFQQIFPALIKFRLANESWSACAPPENILRVLVCLRILMRDPVYQTQFLTLGGIQVLAQNLQKATDSYLRYFGDGQYVVDILKEMTNMFQKLSAVVEQRESIVTSGAHGSLVLLLNANDIVVLHCTLHTLIGLAHSPGPRTAIAELNCIEILLRILQDYDNLSKKLACTLLRLLIQDPGARQVSRLLDGVHILLSLLLHSDSPRLLWNIVWCLVQLADGDDETASQIRSMGGIPLLLALLHERKFVSERHAASAVSTPGSVLETPTVEEQEELREQTLRLKSACCACLSELVLNDTNAQQIVQSNGIYLLSLLVLPQKLQATSTRGTEREKANMKTLQANACRSLRFLFSIERHRQHFKRLFPPELFEMFIDIGHYNKDINAYRKLVEKINALTEDQIEDIQRYIEAFNQNAEVKQYIQDYAVLELLGAGAFGSVYKVKTKSGQSYLAMKEINTVNALWGNGSKERMKSVGDVISELNIIKEELKHPNVVRYYKTFVEKEKLYVVMELIEGAPIGVHFTSLKEKGEKFSEERIWHIFIQLTLALRYLHKEKGIVHRDLTPNNIMLGENDKVTITDFGLAKQKQKDCSKMTSLVGTILYACPEIIQNKPYNAKADVWAIGCILYQMCTLKAPFYSNNMLTLAKIIVEADYAPIPEGVYSPMVVSTVKLCICAEPADRPDIVGVAAHISDVLLQHFDQLRQHANTLDRRLEKERRLRQKHFSDLAKNTQNYHRMYQLSQERYEKVNNLGSSGGAASIKDQDSDSLDTPGFSDTDSSPGFSSVRPRSFHNQPTMRETDDETQAIENGWESDDRADSSGSESRESSAGGLGGHRPPPYPPGGPPGVSRGGGGGVRSKRGAQPPPLIQPSQREQSPFRQLVLEIPSSSKLSRDSGLSSDDPSPNPSMSSASCMSSPASSVTSHDQRPPPHPSSAPPSMHRSISTSAVEMLAAKRGGSVGIRVRPYSAGMGGSPVSGIPSSATAIAAAGPATLTISPRRVRQISDPILQMLHQLHKILYICQLPPTLISTNAARIRLIDRFKRALFQPQSTAFNLKTELRKLLTGSRDTVDLHLGPSESQRLAQQVMAEQQQQATTQQQQQQQQQGGYGGYHGVGVGSVYDASCGGMYDSDTAGDTGFLTYEQMQAVIESVLVECGYYDVSPPTPQHLHLHTVAGTQRRHGVPP